MVGKKMNSFSFPQFFFPILLRLSERRDPQAGAPRSLQHPLQLGQQPIEHLVCVRGEDGNPQPAVGTGAGIRGEIGHDDAGQAKLVMDPPHVLADRRSIDR